MLPDRRLNACRPDLADISLKGEVAADRFVTGKAGHVTAAVAALRPVPDPASGIDTQLLLGEDLTIFETTGGWAWVKAASDGYVGYLPEEAIAPGRSPATHVVAVPRTFLYPAADLRTPHCLVLSMGSRITVTGEAETRGTRYLLLAGGAAIMASHCLPLGQWPSDDPVLVASRFLETPYLWGGRSGFGIDCSGLVQLSHQMTGRQAPRDSDMQRDGFGAEISRDSLRRGDLVFWKGHVGMMEDQDTLLHASGHSMSVTREDFRQALARIGYLYGPPTLCRRPIS
nr:NlpC/P60 family protein [uncultured Gellertiella sp.]